MYKRKIGIRFVIGMLILFLLPPLSAAAESGPAGAPLSEGVRQSGMVRVRLSSLGNPASLKLTLQGPFTLSGQSSRALAGGTTVTVRFSAGSNALSVTANGASLNMGSSFQLLRQDASGGVKIAQGREPGNVYPGDIQFTARGGTLYTVVSVYMEDYLYGVLPYEMGNSSGLEALKAQAVAARTYTLKAMSSPPSTLYDVVDTTSDQVYNGTPSGNENCRRAVDETRGVVAKNGTDFTATYYTASNGGQTESVKNAWNVAGPAYLTVKDDPYDLSNPDSRVNSVTVSGSNPQSNGKIAALLNRKAAAAFGTGAAVHAIYAVTPHTPMFAIPSRVYTKMDFEVGYALNGQSAAGILTFDIFGELESALGMSINSMKNELWTAMQVGDSFVISARRYGHGIGMSQRGAMQMARMGYSYDQILGFYYPGCTRVQYTLTRSGGAEAAPAPPARELPPTPVASAWVNTESGTLNLRAAASTGAQVLCAIPRLETVTIYEQGSDWCKAAYQGQTGYVMTRYLSFGSAPAPETQPAPQAYPVSEGGRAARVATESGSLNLRAQPETGGRVLCAIPQHAPVAVLDDGGEWSQVLYNGIQGYCMTRYLSFQDNQPQAPASPPVSSGEAEAMRTLSMPVLARINTPLSSLNLREGCSLNAQLILEMPKGDYAAILAVGDEWCYVDYNGQTGYCMTQYLEFTLYE